MIPKESVYADWDKLLDFEYNKFDHVFMNALMMRDPESYKLQTLETDAPTGSAIDTDPAKFGYTFGGFDKLRQEGDNQT